LPTRGSSSKSYCVAEWWNIYIDYAALKRQIYLVEKTQQGSNIPAYHDLEANENASLLGQSASSTDHLFQQLLNKELDKITTFYLE
jgi:4-hydroxyphenylpyruvate dioxygenase-like putative hemolysin